MKRKSIKDIDIEGKKILLRVDFNVPVKDGKILDNLRIVSAIKTILYLLDGGAKVAIMSHRGRPKGKKNNAFSMDVCARELEKLLKKTVHFVNDVKGTAVTLALKSLSKGELIMLDNVRFYPEEESKEDATRLEFAKELVSGFDVVVNDAFGTCHRKNASTYDVGLIKEMVMGFLIEKELYYLGDNLSKPKRPFISIMGGAKVSDKLKIIEQMLPKVDKIIIGGAMGYTFYKAMGYNTGKSLVDLELVEYCAKLIEQYRSKIILPPDSKVVKGFNFDTLTVVGNIENKEASKMDNEDMGVDIGEKSIELFKDVLKDAKTILWNGPMGIFEAEETSKGTFAIAHILAKATKQGATTIVGGGDSASAIRQSGFDDAVTHVSTGGGATLEFLSGDELPSIKVMAKQ